MDIIFLKNVVVKIWLLKFYNREYYDYMTGFVKYNKDEDSIHVF